MTSAFAESDGGELGAAESQRACAEDQEEDLPSVAAGTLGLPCLYGSGWLGGIRDRRYCAQRAGTRDQ